MSAEARIVELQCAALEAQMGLKALFTGGFIAPQQEPLVRSCQEALDAAMEGLRKLKSPAAYAEGDGR